MLRSLPESPGRAAVATPGSKPSETALPNHLQAEGTFTTYGVVAFALAATEGSAFGRAAPGATRPADRPRTAPDLEVPPPAAWRDQRQIVCSRYQDCRARIIRILGGNAR